jgi:hypothetical protein
VCQDSPGQVELSRTTDNRRYQRRPQSMSDSQIDPRLFGASSLPPHTQLYASAAPPEQQQQNVGHPYYQQPPHLSQLSQPAPPGHNFDPSLEQTSPTGREASHDDEEQEDDGEHEGYVSDLTMEPGGLQWVAWCTNAQPMQSRYLQPSLSARRFGRRLGAHTPRASDEGIR